MCMAMKSVKRDDDARFHLDSSKPAGPSEPCGQGGITPPPPDFCRSVNPGPTDKRPDVWSRPSCSHTQIFSPKKTAFSLINNTFQKIFDSYLPLFYATFQCGL